MYYSTAEQSNQKFEYQTPQYIQVVLDKIIKFRSTLNNNESVRNFEEFIRNKKPSNTGGVNRISITSTIGILLRFHVTKSSLCIVELPSVIENK